MKKIHESSLMNFRKEWDKKVNVSFLISFILSICYFLFDDIFEFRHLCIVLTFIFMDIIIFFLSRILNCLTIISFNSEDLTDEEE